MTAQVMDPINYEGARWLVADEPLAPFLRAMNGQAPKFGAMSSNCWRGYRSAWEVVDGRLYLRQLVGVLANGQAADLATLFPGEGSDNEAGEPAVFAEWFSGWLRLVRGGIARYVHAGYSSRFDDEIRLKFAAGRLVAKRLS